MKRIAVLIACAAINASTIPAVAAECTSIKDVGYSRALCASVQRQPANVADNEQVCRAYAASFYESVMLRQAAAGRADDAWVLTALDSVVNAFNDLLATKCGG